jgi:hypothetical protein
MWMVARTRILWMRNRFPVGCEEGRAVKTPDYTALRDAVAQISRFYCNLSTATSLRIPVFQIHCSQEAHGSLWATNFEKVLDTGVVSQPSEMLAQLFYPESIWLAPRFGAMNVNRAGKA